MDSRIKSIDDFLDKDDLAYIDSIINFDLYDEKNFTIVDKNFINLPLFFGKILSTTKSKFVGKVFDPKTGKLLEKSQSEKLNNLAKWEKWNQEGTASTGAMRVSTGSPVRRSRSSTTCVYKHCVNGEKNIAISSNFLENQFYEIRSLKLKKKVLNSEKDF